MHGDQTSSRVSESDDNGLAALRKEALNATAMHVLVNSILNGNPRLKRMSAPTTAAPTSRWSKCLLCFLEALEVDFAGAPR
jgi:hypothetical protein